MQCGYNAENADERFVYSIFLGHHGKSDIDELLASCLGIQSDSSRIYAMHVERNTLCS